MSEKVDREDHQLELVYPEDYYDDGFHPDNFTLTARAQETLRWLRTSPVLDNRLYSYDELYKAVRGSHLSRSKFGKYSLQHDLDNLWRLGKIDKYAAGFFDGMEDRPYGVKWLVR